MDADLYAEVIPAGTKKRLQQVLTFSNHKIYFPIQYVTLVCTLDHSYLWKYTSVLDL